MKNKIISALKKFDMSFAWVMLYFYDQVVIGKYTNEELILICDKYDENLCYEVHLFNKEKELRCGENFKFVEIESPKDEKFFMEEKFFILGNKLVKSDGYITLTQYGRKVSLPITLSKQEQLKRFRLVVHHLFDEETGYVNGYRLVDIEGDKDYDL